MINHKYPNKPIGGMRDALAEALMPTMHAFKPRDPNVMPPRNAPRAMPQTKPMQAPAGQIGAMYAAGALGAVKPQNAWQHTLQNRQGQPKAAPKQASGGYLKKVWGK